MRIFQNIRKLYTPVGKTSARGREAMRKVHCYEDAVIVADDAGMIVNIGTAAECQIPPNAVESIDCRGLVALPGFVDSHTHAVFYGDRSEEFAMRAAGKTYQEIAASGGGIRRSVQQVESATAEQIADFSERYLRSALALGTTTMEIKSGYGLSLSGELKLLRAAKLLATRTPMEIHTTFLGAHAIPDRINRNQYVREIIDEQLPAVIKESLAEFCDVFCDEGYFTNAETLEIVTAAKKAGLKIKLHADELACTGGAELAVEVGAHSADHLLKISEIGIHAIATSQRTVATLLPVTALSIRAAYAPARALIDAGAAVAIGTDCNPGSSMSENMQLALTLGVIAMQMTVEEALTSTTLNGAAALGLAATHGSLEPGKASDLALYDIPKLEYLPYHIGVSDVVSVYKRGNYAAGQRL